MNALLRPGELGFIADELRRAGPGAGSAAAQGKGLFSQIALLSNCFGNVILPAGDVVLDDSGPGFDFSTGVPNFEEFGYAAAQLAGSLQGFDGNGPYLRASPGNGPVTVSGAQSGGGDAHRPRSGRADRHPPAVRPEARLQHQLRLPEQPRPRPQRAGRRRRRPEPGPGAMSRALREHSRDVIAIIALVLAALFAGFVILVNQRASLPGWLPVLGADRFELKAEFSSAQAVTPGQGQAVDIAGIQIGDITGVELEDGHAVVTMEVENDKAHLVNEDASLLLRPKTGLNDMVIDVDPGTSDEDIDEGSTVPLSSTQPNVNPDEILAGLDADTQGFLKLLLAGGAEALDPEQRRGEKLGNALRRLEPFARDISRINGALAIRRENIRNAIHNFGLLSQELADKDQDVTAFVDSSDAALESFARQESSIRAALRELPGTLEETRGALGSADRLALNATPALRDLIPGARALKPALEALQPFFQQTTAPIRDQIRPFTTQVASPVHHIRETSVGLGRATPGLRTGFTRLNQGLNGLTYDSPGGQESFAFYVPWLNHNVNNLAMLQDAHGPLPRAQLMLTCNAANLAESTVFSTRPFLLALAQLSGVPTQAQIGAIGRC